MPLKSKAQMRYLFAAEKRGEVKKGTAEKFVKETPKKALKKLPERVAVLSKLKKAKDKKK